MTVRKKMSVGLIGLLVALLTGMAVWPAAGAEVRSRTEIIAEIDEYVRNTMEANHISGASLAVAYGEERFYTQGYGSYADGKPITASTPFPIASLSKSMTALAVLQLADQGRIDLDAPYVSYFPEASPSDERVNRITVRHLLNQTSGLTDRVNPDMTKAVQSRTLQEIVPSLNEVKPAYDPGTKYGYHNPNYQFLALLVERVSGRPFAEYVRDSIFVPLGMKDTYSVRTTSAIQENPAVPRGHYVLLGKPIVQAEPLWFVDGPAGVISTADDMAAWMRAQYDLPLLSPKLLEQYHAAGAVAPYGMGWMAARDDTRGRTISHSGIFWTYKAEETVYLDKRLGIAMMFDTGMNVFVDYGAFVKGVARIMTGEAAERSVINGRNMEVAMLLLLAATMLRGGYRFYRLKTGGNRNAASRGRLILSAASVLLPALLLLGVKPILAFVGGGRVLPWTGIWMAMPSLIVWLATVAAIQLGSFVWRLRLYFNGKRRGG
ncbi:serine hydrolase domain-containing protein [Paenibacillus flagellatus]|uniref:Serine hydrolase n=1 Tax=Paenibacillus flagellatus TaxID=2211139 RepID=A0A2V5KM35_9BACL|nr:serine hydrolase domain-containing protein [Paenibacillus flagellatus]PYI56120.1 serine hydrolase [Paenibacillus flagellatus]